MSNVYITSGGIEDIIERSDVDPLGFVEIEQTKDKKTKKQFLTIYVSSLDKPFNFPTKSREGPMLTRLSKGLESRDLYLARASLEHNTFVEEGKRKTKKYMTGNLYRKKKKK
ncbi:hypothetical protein HOG16_02960 [Candidatus Woesearchaeota archaeon]|jgi:hypothetical protein|nr:hypothetical protein [Candidatus Woesearchaeota archaeon]MBT4322296.1 hypothetical protein [Candidatus Woesearchaeota archaeon]MBT4630861.1 hypothetical protein [Candidatus Woesearchaeota archaeon]